MCGAALSLLLQVKCCHSDWAIYFMPPTASWCFVSFSFLFSFFFFLFLIRSIPLFVSLSEIHLNKMSKRRTVEFFVCVFQEEMWRLNSCQVSWVSPASMATIFIGHEIAPFALCTWKKKKKKKKEKRGAG